MKTTAKIFLSLLLSTLTSVSFAQMNDYASTGKLQAKSEDAAKILRDIVAIPDDTIPESLLQKATCIATFPNVIRIGFGFGVRFGKGLVSCRVPGGWSNPSFMKVKGGSWGLQIGASSTDLILVFVKDNAPERLSVGNFTVGGDASVAVGPVGRHLEAGTDYQLNSEIYAYSQSRGLFAGLTIEGALMNVDDSANITTYGRDVDAKKLLTTEFKGNRTVNAYVNALNDVVH